MTTRQNQRLSEIAVNPTFRMIDGVSIRFVESDTRHSNALLLSPWSDSVLAYESTWSRLAETTQYLHERLPHSELHLTDSATLRGRTPLRNMQRS